MNTKRMSTALLPFLACTLVVATTHATDFYVAPNGNDAWSGVLADPNDSASDGPFATIEHARYAVRQLKRDGRLKEPVRVVLRDGTHRLTQTLELTPEDCGTAYATISYEARKAGHYERAAHAERRV